MASEQIGDRPWTVVTGATGGIGSSCVRRLSVQGKPIALLYRSSSEKAQALEKSVEEAGGLARSWKTDLTDPKAVKAVVDEIDNAGSGIGAVVHAAGPLVPMTHLSKVEPSTYAEHLTDEAASFFNLVHAVLPALRRSQGNVVAVTTVATSRYPVRDGLSAGTKGAVEQLVRAFAVEEGRFGVRFNSIGPAILADGMVQKLRAQGELTEADLEEVLRRTPMRRFGSTMDIANAVAFLSSDEANWITGQKLNVDGGYSI